VAGIVQMPHNLTLVIRMPHNLTLVIRMPHNLTLDFRKIYTLIHYVWKAKCYGMHYQCEICPDTYLPKSTCRGGRCPDATCYDTCGLEEIHPVTCHLEEIYLDTLCLEGICPDVRRPEGTCRGVRRLDVTCMALVDTKKRPHFEKCRLEGYCGAHLRLVHTRMAGTYWEWHVHWQAESTSICGGTCR